MWISQFTCGILATLLVEMVAFIAYGFYLTRKDKDNEETDSTN